MCSGLPSLSHGIMFFPSQGLSDRFHEEESQKLVHVLSMEEPWSNQPLNGLHLVCYMLQNSNSATAAYRVSPGYQNALLVFLFLLPKYPACPGDTVCCISNRTSNSQFLLALTRKYFG